MDKRIQKLLTAARPRHHPPNSFPQTIIGSGDKIYTCRNLYPVTQLNQEMAEATDLQHSFAVAYVTNGGNASKAARQAGYKNSAARVIGSRLIRDVKIQHLIRMEQTRVLGERLCSRALGLLEQIMDDPNLRPVHELMPQRPYWIGVDYRHFVRPITSAPTKNP